VSEAQTTRAYATAVLVVLTAINFLNYIDRYVLAAVLESVRLDFGLDDADSGLLGLMFIVVYSIASPFTGWLGDRSTRKYLVAGGVGLWSLATVGCGYADSHGELLVMRALVGIGEAGYATVAPAMIADVFEPRRRGRMLAYFYLAIPVGSALGYVLGGWIAGSWESLVSPGTLAWLGLADAADPGWRLAFLFAGVPGLLFALGALMLAEPIRGGRDAEGARGEAGHELAIELPRPLAHGRGPSGAVRAVGRDTLDRHADAGQPGAEVADRHFSVVAEGRRHALEDSSHNRLRSR
jgi:MFS family permease